LELYIVRDLLCESIIMPDPQSRRKLATCVTYGKCQRSFWHQLTLASCEFYS